MIVSSSTFIMIFKGQESQDILSVKSIFIFTALLLNILVACPNDKLCRTCITQPENTFKCISCQNSYLDIELNFCKSIKNPIMNCINYDSSNQEKCIDCRLGFYANIDGECVECSFRCQICNAGECIGCSDRQIPFEKDCINSKTKCGDQNCQICDKQDKCLQCDNGFAITSQGNCLRSGDYCTQIDEKEVCFECWQDYYLDGELKCIEIQTHLMAWHFFVAIMLVLILVIGVLFMKREHKINRRLTEDSYQNIN
jgi:hypothetical protein